MKKFLPDNFVFAALLVMFSSSLWVPVPASAQTPQVATLKQLLREYKRKHDNALELLRGYKNDRARDLLTKSEDLARQAEDFLRRDKPSQARQTILLAHKYLDKAIQIALTDAALRLIAQVNETMRRAEGMVIGSGNREAERMLQAAKKNQREAEYQRRLGHYSRAVERYRIALYQAEQAMRVLSVSGGRAASAAVRDLSKQDQARFEALASRTYEAIQQSHNKNARGIYEQAMLQARKAEEAWRLGNKALARQLYSNAMRLLVRALDLASGQANTGAAYLRSELETLKVLFEEVRRKADLMTNPQLNKVLDRVHRHLSQAAIAIEEKQLQKARAELGLARSILSRILREAGRRSMQNEQRIAQELANLQEDIKSVGQQIATSPDARADELLELAKRAARRAEKMYRAGQHRAAIQSILAAQKFLSVAEAIAADRAPSISETLARRNVANLEQMIREIDSSAIDNPDLQNDDLLNQARQMLGQAQQKLAEGSYLVAYEFANIGINFAKRALRSSRND